MLTVELIVAPDCPNAKAAREQLLRAFTDAGLSPQWQEWISGAPESPAYTYAYGSPTTLVNGQDVADASPSAKGHSCRLYMDREGQLSGVPSVEAITSALLRAKGSESLETGATVRPGSSRRQTLAVIPAIITALLPKLTCPACWPAYAGLLSAFGLGFVNYTPYLLPLTALFLILAVGSLWYGAKNRRDYTPFMLGILSASTVIIGKFVLESKWAMYGGIALLMGASLWNAWPLRVSKSGSCSECAPTGTLMQKDLQKLSKERRQ
ncbi:MAG: MerC family mercury resistance protein [Acidobacteriota bacterium]